MNRKLAAILIVLAMFASGTALADDLLINKIDDGKSAHEVRPPRGATMSHVQTNFGEPVVRTNAVGDPPITRWEYGDFLVFFEYDRVIDTVEKSKESS